jgi:hypothetical protein
MATNKYKCPPQPASGQGTFSDNLVGFQLVDGGGFTQGNFEFTTSISEKQERTFSIGSFSEPISLDTLNISNVEESKKLIADNFRVYPNFDLSQVTNFTMFGSLTKRMSTSVTNIINYFPAALDINNIQTNFVISLTAQNIIYNSVEDETYFEIPISVIRNPFSIDYTVNATRNIELREISVSYLRNFTTQYLKYSLFLNDIEYPISDFIPAQVTDTVFKVYVNGDPFSGNTTTNSNFIIRPKQLYVNKVFNENLDQVENFLLNRNMVPIYSSYFNIPKENDDGQFYYTQEVAIFPLNGLWNLDIITPRFTNYLTKLNSLSESIDLYKTNLITRFLTADAIKEFDTSDQKIQKVLQIYGRSFDETRKFITALANMNSVNYNIKNDIPSQLLKNLAQTLGWNTNISPITNDQLLSSVFSNGSNSFTGLPIGQTPEELNYQYFRNLILNSAFLFKSKGTRKSIEILLRMVGAPEALTEFNEYIYLADQKINLRQFDIQYAQISGGTYSQELPVLDTNDLFSIMGVQYTGFTTTTITQDISLTVNDYPIDSYGFPSMPVPNDTYFFQIGGGWFESTPQHRMPEKVDLTNSTFTGSNPNYQTKLLPFNYGQEYLERYRSFPYMNLGFNLKKTVDNKKSWINNEKFLRKNFDGNFNAYYKVSDDRLVINVKNVDLFMNPSQGLVYDVWTMSRKYNYPIPEQGLSYIDPTYCNPYPNVEYPNKGGIDWTQIIPKPKEKTFFEFAQTFWKNMINVRSRQFNTDGKTSGYPTLSSIYWKYLESGMAINIPNDNFNYQTMIDYVNGMGDYWIRLVEQMIPATTIWNTGVKYENSIFHRQKFVWRRQKGCEIIPVPCKPCKLITQIFSYDCPIQQTVIGLYPWDTNPTITSFGALLGSSLTTYGNDNNVDINNDCLLNTLESDWYIDIRIDGSPIIIYPFFNGVGFSNPTLSTPTANNWVDGLYDAFTNLLDYGLSYIINTDDQTITIYNNNCLPLNTTQNFELNVGINFTILCNP